MTWSDEASQVLGGAEGRLPETLDGLLAILPGEDRDRLRAALERGLAEGGDHATEFRLPREDGEPARIRMAGRVITDDTGRPVRIVGIAADVTEQRRSEEHLRQVQRMSDIETLNTGTPLVVRPSGWP